MEETGRKPWKYMQQYEINRIIKEKCKRCRYRGRIASGSGLSTIVCNYIGITGHSRDVDPRDCEYYKENAKGEKKHDSRKYSN